MNGANVETVLLVKKVDKACHHEEVSDFAPLVKELVDMVENNDRQDVSEAESRNQDQSIRAKLSQVCDTFRIPGILVSFEDIKVGNVAGWRGEVLHLTRDKHVCFYEPGSGHGKY